MLLWAESSGRSQAICKVLQASLVPSWPLSVRRQRLKNTVRFGGLPHPLSVAEGESAGSCSACFGRGMQQTSGISYEGRRPQMFQKISSFGCLENFCILMRCLSLFRASNA